MQSLLKTDAPARTSWDEAFEQYYAKGYNSASVTDYGLFLERVFRGTLLSAPSRTRFLQLMLSCQTGPQRLKAGLPPDVLWAHKTGTQHRRVCDFGLLLDREVNPKRACVLLACVRGLSTPEEGEEVLRRIATLLTKFGLFSEFSTNALRSTL
ncbi:MAG: serine hydrolase [Bdellovibrionales bacterium]